MATMLLWQLADAAEMRIHFLFQRVEKYIHRSSMHLTRPKSSKGRCRPAGNSSLCTAASDNQEPPELHGSTKRDRSFRSRSQPELRQGHRWSGDKVLKMWQQAPAAPPRSFNKYKVLPSIGGRQFVEGSPGERLNELMSELHLSEDAVTQSCEDRRTEAPEAAASCCRLLLAVRAPCGQRFQQHFDPADSLQVVRSSAEVQFAASYRGTIIETMEVPRRTFTDMNMTLAQCGIPNRSVLCISQNNEQMEEEQEN